MHTLWSTKAPLRSLAAKTPHRRFRPPQAGAKHVNKPYSREGASKGEGSYETISDSFRCTYSHELGDAGVKVVQLLYAVRRVVYILLGDLE